MKITEITSGKWHPEIKISDDRYPSNYINILNVNSGCGAMIIQGYSSIRNNYDIIYYFKKLIEDYTFCKEEFKKNNIYENRYDIGAVITTVGESHIDKEYIKELFKIGFKIKATYNNYRHGSTYKQHLLVWEIKR